MLKVRAKRAVLVPVSYTHLTHELWTDLSRQIFTFLEGITLAQFVERPAVCEVVRRQNSTRRRERHSHEPIPIAVAVV